MHKRFVPTFVTLAALVLGLQPAAAEPAFSTGKPPIRSLSALAFGPDGVLFIGDGKGGAVFAVDLGDKTTGAAAEDLQVADVEAKIAALLGIAPADVMVHDLAVNPISQRIYLAVSGGRGKWTSAWTLPNDIADANVLLAVDTAGKLAHVPLDEVRYARAELPNPIDPAKTHQWKKDVSLRADTITDMAYDAGALWVAGLSNEEFASTLWRLPYPFTDGATATTLEIYHGAHGAYETHAPIRTFVPYRLKGEPHLLAAYLCTPFVTFKTADLADGKHVKGRTVGEFGWGNYPLDMVAYKKDGQDRLLIANSNLSMMILDPRDIESFEGALTEKPSTYVAGIPYEPRSGTGIQQLDLLNPEHVVILKRQPGGSLALVAAPVELY